jgi:hypothetical protein
LFTNTAVFANGEGEEGVLVQYQLWLRGPSLRDKVVRSPESFWCWNKC